MKVTIEISEWLEQAIRKHRPHAHNYDCSWCVIRDGIGYVAGDSKSLTETSPVKHKR